ncbi:RlpA-like double-psi beta-barrel-protein domain-containing protein-containing protein [Circinella umbellata]|nr:RlpA-like double-psi beta-barrel-protein domain-containing protein-containing protein [Circinella umbellata]
MYRNTLLASILLIALIFSTAFTTAAPVPHLNTLEKRAKTYRGTATWFLPKEEGGEYGACGPKENNYSMIVALNAKQYGNMNKKSKWCGKKIKVKGPHGSAIVKVNDACPGCSYGDLDLTPKVFKKVVGNMNKGVGKITWHAV